MYKLSSFSRKLRKIFTSIKLFISTKSHLPPYRNNISDVIKTNRSSLDAIPTWIDKDAMQTSYFNYGVPDFILEKLNKHINEEITYTDLITYYSLRLNKPVNYLELGVSVGKNFWQIINFLNNANIVGFDIEDMNPILERNLLKEKVTEWNLENNSLRKKPATLTSYSFSTNNINYLAGDILDENCWKKLAGNKFNIIFSDALHEAQAILYEYNMLKKYDLLNDEFIFLWDDLNYVMVNSFLEIANDLKKTHKGNGSLNVYTFKINGWLGQHFQKHDVGLITNIPLNIHQEYA